MSFSLMILALIQCLAMKAKAHTVEHEEDDMTGGFGGCIKQIFI